MPDHPRSAHAGASAARIATSPVRVRLTGIATDPNSRLTAARRALDDARLDPRGLAAVINVGDAWESAAAVVGRLGLGGAPDLRVLDMVDDGCGVPSSIAVGASILAQWGGAVLLTVDGGALVLGTMPMPATPRPGPVRGGGRRTADVKLTDDGPRTAVEQVLSTVGDGVPIVAVVPGGIRLAPGRRFASVSLAATGATPIEGLLQARAEGLSEVVLVTANEQGRAAAVMCGLGGGTRADSGRGQRQ
ncbi:hypothetical protein [Gordonia phthalatica]|uniref:Uncharacterized protein n=1 Tax=Gordonia phthalatica TaxID=1136941 RepID=A0A0N9MU82_9ACTN|nr:hypothetical protein [Gordonia phthalatica]ALG86156.1 hypothetical protein ACH46_18730 [Gordonia phthalatica]